MKNEKLIVTVAVVALVLAGLAVYVSYHPKKVDQLASATPGSNYIENYSPAVLYNGGISSALPIQTTSDLTAGTVTSTGLTTTATLLVGTSGTTVSKMIAPVNCTVIASPQTITASSTKDVDCAVTGLTSAMTVYPVATTTMSSTYLGLRVSAAHASSTSGYATLTVQNLTGTTYTWDATASTSLKISAEQ